jgi:serine/threonine protein kinase
MLENDRKKSEESSGKILDLLEAQGQDLIELKQIVLSGLLRNSQLNKMVEEAELHPKIIARIVTGSSQSDAFSLDDEKSTSCVPSTGSIIIQDLMKIDFQKLKLATKRLLGKGTSAKVFECQYGEQTIAVKQIQDVDTLKEDEIQRVRREVLILQHMSHKNIIQFFGADLEKGLILIELGNVSLYQVIHQKKPLPNLGKFNITTKVRIMSDVLRAVRYIHSLNIIHRDLKSDNILLFLVSDSPPVGGVEIVAKLADFGLAKVLETTGFWQTQQASNPITDVGSKAYLAPEGFSTRKNLSSQELKATDMYSLGVFLNELLCEELPWEGKVTSVVTMKEKILEGERPTAFQETKNWMNILGTEPARNNIVPDLTAIIGNKDAGLLATNPDARPDAKTLCKRIQLIGQNIPGFSKVTFNY